MAAIDESLPGPVASGDRSQLLAAQWRRLIRAATIVAVLTSPAVFVWLHSYQDFGIGWSLSAAS